MKSLFLVAVGVVIGFLLAHRADRTRAGGRFLAEVDTRTKAFTRAIADGYRSREAELRSHPDA